MVEVATAKALPWGLTGKVASTFGYVIFKGIKFEIRYGGEECVLEGVEAFFTTEALGTHKGQVLELS